MPRTYHVAVRLTVKRTYVLTHAEIVRKGYISKMMPEYHEEIEICDKLRECLLIEESETFCVFN